jgi:hypothetical protein
MKEGVRVPDEADDEGNNVGRETFLIWRTCPSIILILGIIHTCLGCLPMGAATDLEIHKACLSDAKDMT